VASRVLPEKISGSAADVRIYGNAHEAAEEAKQQVRVLSPGAVPELGDRNRRAHQDGI
jgi:predicted phosphodiesterase